MLFFFSKMNRKRIIENVEKMFLYRGHTNISKSQIDKYIMIFGDKNKFEKRCVAIISFENEYKFQDLNSAFDKLEKEAISKKFNSDDIVIFIHKFVGLKQRITKMKTLSAKFNCYFEYFQILDFIVDHSKPHATKNWRIVKSKDTELIEGKEIDKSPEIFVGDVKIKYLGARVGDYVIYETVDLGDTGPYTFRTLIKVTEKEVGTTELSTAEND